MPSGFGPSSSTLLTVAGTNASTSLDPRGNISLLTPCMRLPFRKPQGHQLLSSPSEVGVQFALLQSSAGKGLTAHHAASPLLHFIFFLEYSAGLVEASRDGDTSLCGISFFWKTEQPCCDWKAFLLPNAYLIGSAAGPRRTDGGSISVGHNSSGSSEKGR